MANKPTYKELEQQIKELRRQAVKLERAEKALKVERKRLFALLDGLPGYVYLQGPDHSIRFANRSFRERFGEPEGRACYQVITGRDKPCKLCRPFSVFETGRPLEWEWVRGDGRVYQIYDYPFSDIDGSPLVLELGIEVTERKHAEEALRRSENKYKTLLEHLPQKIFLKNNALVYLSCNENYARDLNIKSEEIKDKTDYDFFPKALAEKYRADDKRIVASGNTEDIEEKYLQDGQEVWVHTVKTPIKDEKGNITGVLGIFWDITKRKHAKEALRESEAQKRAILDASIDRIRYIDKDMRIIWANKTTAEASNMSPEDLVGQLCFRLFLGRDTPCEECPTKKSQETGRLERAVIRYPRVRGIEGESYWDNYSVPIKNEAGDIVSFIQIARNITDQKRAEEHIRTLTHELIKAQERERQKISCELHDSVAQNLATAKIICETLFVNQPTVPREIRHRVSELSKILHGSITAVRDLAYDLRPSGLDQLGLIQTTFQYCEDFSEKTGLSVDFSSAGMDDLKMDSDTEINLYRLVQEGLNNVRKHAEATRSIVKLVLSLSNIILRIEDNGKGFDAKDRWVTASQEKQLGLTSMEERVSLLGGTMTIQSSPMRGTKIFIKVPYEREKD
jgi:PAS domain S-box-containing protein